MERHFILEYWLDDGWYVGKLREVPGVFSQGKSLQELEENIRDAYKLMVEEAVREVQIAKTAWLEAARAEGKPIPLPRYRPVIYQVAAWGVGRSASRARPIQP